MSNLLDHEDERSWYFGAIGRKEAQDVLMAEKEGGVFLVRDSASSVGDYVLCVKEDSKVSHYIINKTKQNDLTMFRIGDQYFKNLPELISFYKLHYLDTTPLIRPASKKLEKVIAKFDFDSQERDDLSFKKGDILTVTFKEEEQWWRAKDKFGNEGSIPVPYVQKYEESQSPVETPRQLDGPISSTPESKPKPKQRKLPAYARVKQARIPNAYDDTALKLEKGDTIKVLKMNMNGQWEGELHGKIGFFPFTHVEFLDDENES
ncbi:adapter molecule Crk [Sitophilus oryzae]|uniref:Adapter molecule Crk n=1 Tax=Sitophilus oryzae TaxID=7048 RepID=A0A6J2XBU8_SITOR|nr:adapter molecule Crk [Sitophilus oryzae]